jgi:N-acetyl-gamma-glutamylphosphate reductase
MQHKPDIEPKPNDEFLWLDETTGQVYTNAQLIEIVNRSSYPEVMEVLKNAAAIIDEMPEQDEKEREELLGRIDDLLVKLKEGKKR